MLSYKINKTTKNAGICIVMGVGLMFVPGNSEWLPPVFGTNSALAQGCCGGAAPHGLVGESDPDNDQPSITIDSGPTGRGLTNSATETIVAELESIVAECISLPAEYRADCLAQNLKEAGGAVRNASYSEVNSQLRTAGSRISREVARNVDRSKPTIKRNGKTFRAVKKSAVAKVNKVATRVVETTAKNLIRSAGNSAVKKVHFARIARAVDNTKVLLRSA